MARPPGSAPISTRPPGAATSASLPSLLDRPGEAAARRPTEAEIPIVATDLRLDVLAAMSPALGWRLFVPLRDPDAVAYRQEVFRDLADPALLEAAATFIDAIDAVRGHLDRRDAIRHGPQRGRWHLEALSTYCTAVVGLSAALDQAEPRSRALNATRAALRDLTDSPAFSTLSAETGQMLDALAAIRYRLRIDEHQIVVRPADDAADYGAEVLATFARLWPADAAAPPPVAVDVFRSSELDRVQRAILDKVVRLHPAVFRSLADLMARTGDAIDPALDTLADELRFYLDWLALLEPLREAGIPASLPVVSADGPRLDARGLVDIELATRLVGAAESVVASDLTLDDGEWLVVVTGPNQGGKSTFARAIGQLVHLASVGVPLPVTGARVRLADAVHTLFARAEDPADLIGRLEAELVRTRAILDVVGPDSVVILNDAFSSTTVDDALALDRAVLDELRATGATAVVVTFLGELATFDPGTVSLACVLEPGEADEPPRPTFRLERGPADPLAQARAVARAHALDRASVHERISR